MMMLDKYDLTREKLIEYIKANEEAINSDEAKKEYFAVLLEAVNRMVSKVVTYPFDDGQYVCPSCGLLHLKTTGKAPYSPPHFCAFCGQRFDWSYELMHKWESAGIRPISHTTYGNPKFYTESLTKED